MLYQIHVPDRTGHTTFKFSKADAKAIQKKLDEILLDKGGTIAQRKAGERDYTVNKTFDPSQDEALHQPHLKGG